jgi:hypothetical protein
MPTATRILRALAEQLDPTMHERTAREEKQFRRIMLVAPTLLTAWSADRFSFTALATAMKMGTGTLRRHFVDIPALLGFLIRAHLQDIAAALAAIPPTAPNCHRLRRAAYLAATRTADGAQSRRHLLLLNNLPHLPDDVRLPLLELQEQIASCLAEPEEAGFALSLLDNPLIPPRRVEAILGTPSSAWHDPPAPEPRHAPPGTAETQKHVICSGEDPPGGGPVIRLRPHAAPHAAPAPQPVLPPPHARPPAIAAAMAGAP